MGSLLDCIVRIPHAVEQIVDRAPSTMGPLVEYISACEGLRRIVFVASGSSYNAAFAVRSFFEDTCGLETHCVYPNVFANYTKQLSHSTLYVMISQGGNTKLVFDGLQRVSKQKCMGCALTYSNQSEIAKAADVAIEIGCGQEEYMYRTLGYSCTVATLYCMAIELGCCLHGISTNYATQLYQELCRSAANLGRIRTATQTWYCSHRFSLLRRNKAMFTGAGDYWATAQEADIKMMEMVPMLTRSFELEEFIHGPQNAFDADTSFFVLSKKGEDDDKAKAIAAFLKKEISFCCIVGANTCDENDLPLNISSSAFAPLEMITVFQMLAFLMAEDRGRDLGRGVNAQVADYIKKTL